MTKAYMPELKKFLNKMVYMKLDSKRGITGTLVGYDPCMNVVLENAVQENDDGTKTKPATTVVRGNTINMLYILESL